MRAGYCRPSPDFNENAPSVHSVVFHDLRGWRRGLDAAARRYPVLLVVACRDARAVRAAVRPPGVLECRFPAMPSIITRGAPIRTDSVAPGNHASGPPAILGVVACGAKRRQFVRITTRGDMGTLGDILPTPSIGRI
jgi:hypothetical protein